MPRLPYRILYNQDCTNLFSITEEQVGPRHVEHMVDEVADAGVDVFLVNPNAQRANFPSRARQTYWDGYRPGDRNFFGPVPDDTVPRRDHWVRQMKGLADQGCNYLEHALGCCRKRGIVPGVSVRMNDLHDMPWVGSHTHSQFFLDHPEYRLELPQICGWGCIALNYAHEEVREHYLAFIGELAEDYDFEVLELDFLRFTSYFPRTEFKRHCAIMSDFIREVRGVLQGSGKEIALVPRVATNPAAAYELGFDVATWAQEGLIDGLTIGGFHNTSWEMAAEAYREMLGETALYASTEFSANREDGLESRYLPLEAELMRGFASGYLAAGADGVCIFNFFCAREMRPQRGPLFDVIGSLGQMKELRDTERTHLITSGRSQCEADGPIQVPVSLEIGRSQCFQILLARPTIRANVEARITFTTPGEPAAGKLWLQANDTPLGPAREVQPVEAPEAGAQAAIFAVSQDVLRDGRNRLTLRNEGRDMTVRRVEVRISPREMVRSS